MECGILTSSTITLDGGRRITMSNNEVCQICGGLGLVTLDVPVGHPDFGKAFPCICQADRVKTQKSTKLRTVSNLDAMTDKTFATYEVDYTLLDSDDFLRSECANLSRGHHLTEEHRRHINIAAELALRYADDPQGWLVLWGTYGTGKTHLAAAIANRRMERSMPVLFLTVPDLLDHLKATFGPTSEVAYDERFEQIRTIPFLVLDDLGAEKQSDWAQEKLYQLLDYRHIRKLPTVVTTNNPLETLEPRIRSRLTDNSITRLIRLEVPDRRSSITTWQDLDLSNLDRYRDMTFDTLDARNTEGLADDQVRRFERGLQIIRNYAANPVNWLVVMGEPGSGKTHLAAAIAHECRARGDHPLFVTASELLDHLRVTFSPGSHTNYDRRMSEIKDASLIVLDNLIIDKNLSSWARDKLFEILIYRFDYRLPTVITTYQTLADMDSRLRSRITNDSHCEVVAITVPSYPGKTVRRRAAAPRRA
jgi:DNA replication protein DnaC